MPMSIALHWRRAALLAALLAFTPTSAQDPVPVEVIRIEATAFAETLELTGTITAQCRAQLSPRVAERLDAEARSLVAHGFLPGTRAELDIARRPWRAWQPSATRCARA